MDLKFSEMSVDTSLAQEYLNKNKTLSELCNNYDEITKKFDPYVYDGNVFKTGLVSIVGINAEGVRNKLLNMASSLKQNGALIAQLEYLFRNIPIEVTNMQLDLLIKYLRCYVDSDPIGCINKEFHPDASLLMIATKMHGLCKIGSLICLSKTIAAISYLLFNLLHGAQGAEGCCLYFKSLQDSPTTDSLILTNSPIRGLESGTVAVLSDDADVDSAVGKLISVSTKAPWRLRRILVQESVYQQFKDTLSWKCNLKKSEINPLTSDILCSDTLTYNDITFLMDPVELTEENPSVVTVEAYRTTKEVISLVQQDKTRYLSLWTNGIAEINEVTHSTKSPVVWVNNVADFRGPAQVAEAVFSYTRSVPMYPIGKCDRFTKLCELAQSWLKLDLESRHDILCGVLDKYTLSNPANKQYTEIKNSLLTYTVKSFVDVGKDYVCIGMSQPVGVMGYTGDTIFSVEFFKSILQGNAFYVIEGKEDLTDYTLLEKAGVPVIRVKPAIKANAEVIIWRSGLDTVTRVIWTNSGTIFAN